MDDKDITTETIIAAISAIAEQLDLDRAIAAIRRQRDVIAHANLPRGDEVVAALDRIGIALTDISAQRATQKTRGH